MEGSEIFINILAAIVIVVGIDMSDSHGNSDGIIARLAVALCVYDMFVYKVPELLLVLIVTLLFAAVTYSDRVDFSIWITKSIIYLVVGVFTILGINYVGLGQSISGLSLRWLEFSVIDAIVYMIAILVYEWVMNQYEMMVVHSQLIEQNESYRKQLKLLSQSEDNIRKVRHDMKNHISVMKSLIESKNYTRLEDYVNSINDVISTRKGHINTGNYELDAIVNNKVEEATNKGIKVDSRFLIPASLPFGTLDLATVFGNIFDNAIRGVEDLEEERRRITCNVTYDKGMLNVLMSNPCKKELVNTTGNELPKTTKSDKTNHGIGLRSVKEVAQKYEGVMEVTIEDDEFKLSIEMYS